MASIDKRPNGTYRARWREHPGAPQKVRVFARKVDAERFLTGVEHAKLTGAYVDPGLGRRSFGDYAARWLATKADLRPRTLINVEGRLRNHVLPVFGERPIGSVRPEDVRSWVASLSATKGLAPATVKAAYLVLSQVMASAEVDGLIGRTPCIGVRLPRDTHHGEVAFLSPGQIGALADVITPRFRVLILAAAYTGLRAGELAALRTERVNFLKSKLAVHESLSEVRGRLTVGPTKTGATREVPMPRFLVDELAEHVRRFPSPDGYVFTMAEGGPVRHRNFYRRHFRPAVTAAELPAELRFHDLRHTCAALLIDRGASPKQVAAILGHSTIRVTFDRYGHLFDDHADTLMVALHDAHAQRAEDSLRTGSISGRA